MAEARRPGGRKAGDGSRRELLRLNISTSTPAEIADALHSLLERAGVEAEERVQMLAGALVIEALRPYWRMDRSPEDAHAALMREDPALAEVIEAIAPMILGRAEVREEAAEVIASIEALLGFDPGDR